jgi:molecular chaperone HtpG
MSDTVAEKHDFGAEVGRLLDLVVHSLYSEREIFLRELVANAADAMDRRRFESLTDSALAPPAEAKVRIVPDKQARTLLIADDGIGMGRQELIDNLGTIARSGTRAFGAALDSAKPEERPSLIGQFGVGFYSAFMVADRVEVTSRKAGSDEAFTWASDGAGQFTIAPGTRETAGTDVVLHIKSDAEEFLDPIRLEAIVRKWADHVTLPITIARDGKDLPANEGTALWRKPRADVSEQSYNEFYRHLGNIFDTPWATLHWKAEGMLEFFALLFVPGMKPFEPVEGDRDSHVRLHVRRMFITDKADLLPHWLRFVQGVVDTEDLPLNVSREMLQTTPVLGRIRKALIGRVMSERQVLGQFWSGAEGGRLGRRRTSCRDRAVAAVPVVVAGRLDVIAGLPVAHAGRPGHDLLPGGRQSRRIAHLTAARGLPRQGHRGAVAARSDRCVLAGPAG